MRKQISLQLLAGIMAISLTACGGAASSSESSTSSASSTGSAEMSSSESETVSALSSAETAGESISSSGSSSSSSSAAANLAISDLKLDDVDMSNVKIGVVMKSSDEFQNSVVEGAKDAFLEAGGSESNFKNVASTSESDAMQQVTAIEDMVSNNIDILLCSCQEENTLKGTLQAAADAGVKVVMVDTDCASLTDKVTYIGTDNYQAAYDGAKEFAKRLEKGTNVVILRGKLGDVNHEDRTEGLQTALEEAGMKVLEVQDANCETDKAANIMEQFISKYDDIGAVMVTSDSMAVGAAQAIKGAGVEGIKICGFDGFQSAIQLVETGEIEMIIGQKPYQIGYDGVVCGLGSMTGQSYDDYINPGIQIIDQDNYKDFLKE
ncbi:MAG: sugar ABC transporter substrate-binding protein [Bilifractor sp.]|jgi:ribose transport system substrate-binding protein